MVHSLSNRKPGSGSICRNAIENESHHRGVIAPQVRQFSVGILAYHEALQQSDQGSRDGPRLGVGAEFAGFFPFLDQFFKIRAVTAVGFGQSLANRLPKRRGRAHGEELEPEAERPAMAQARLQAGLAGSIKKLAGGQIAGLSEHAFLFFERAVGVELIHCQHELLFAFEIEIRRAPRQTRGIRDIGHAAVGQAPSAERGYSRIHQLALHPNLVAFFRHCGPENSNLKER